MALSKSERALEWNISSLRSTVHPTWRVFRGHCILVSSLAQRGEPWENGHTSLLLQKRGGQRALSPPCEHASRDEEKGACMGATRGSVPGSLCHVSRVQKVWKVIPWLGALFSARAGRAGGLCRRFGPFRGILTLHSSSGLPLMNVAGRSPGPGRCATALQDLAGTPA